MSDAFGCINVVVVGGVFSYYFPQEPLSFPSTLEHLNTQVETGPVERFYLDNDEIVWEWRESELTDEEISDLVE